VKRNQYPQKMFNNKKAFIGHFNHKMDDLFCDILEYKKFLKDEKKVIDNMWIDYFLNYQYVNLYCTATSLNKGDEWDENK